MSQCEAKVKSGRQCQKLALRGKRFCSVHRGNFDWKRTAAMVAGGLAAPIVAPSAAGVVAQQLWTEIVHDFEAFYPSIPSSVKDDFVKLGSKDTSIDDLVATIIKLLKSVVR